MQRIAKITASTVAIFAAMMIMIDVECAETCDALDAEFVVIEGAHTLVERVLGAEDAAVVEVVVAPQKTDKEILEDAYQAIVEDIKLRRRVIAEMRDARVGEIDSTVQLTLSNLAILVDGIKIHDESARYGHAATLAKVERAKARLGEVEMPEGFDEYCFDVLAMGRIVSKDARWECARRIAAVANTVDGVEGRTWMPEGGKICRVYVEMKRSHNGGKGTIGCKTYITIDEETASQIMAGDFEDCAVLSFDRRDFSGAATEKTLRDVEIPALDQAFTDAKLAIVVE